MDFLSVITKAIAGILGTIAIVVGSLFALVIPPQEKVVTEAPIPLPKIIESPASTATSEPQVSSPKKTAPVVEIPKPVVTVTAPSFTPQAPVVILPAPIAIPAAPATPVVPPTLPQIPITDL